MIYRFGGVHPDEEMNWKVYAIAMLLFNGLGLLVVYLLQRIQGVLPLNPQGFGAVSPDSSWISAWLPPSTSSRAWRKPAA